MRKAITTLVLALTGALFGIGSAVVAPQEATASPIAHEGFAYPAGPLPGKNGGSGFIGAWAGDIGVVVQPGLGLQHPLALPSAGSMIGGGFIASRNLSAVITQNVFWASFLMRFDPGNDQVWLGFDVFGTALPAISFGRRLNAYFIQNGSNPAATLPGASPPGVTDLLIARITRGGGITTVDLWVNKLPTGLPDLTHVFGGVPAPSVVNTQVQPGIFSDEIRIGTTATDVAAARVRSPQLGSVDWTKNGSIVRFHQRWENPDPSGPSEPVNGNMDSQPFGVYAPNFGSIGTFSVPSIPANSFFDVFIDIPLSQLPPEPMVEMPGGGPGAITGPGAQGAPCPPDTSWRGNVDIVWSGPGGTGQVNRHFGDLLVCPGATPTYIHVLTFCGSALGANWNIVGLCPGFTATLVNEDKTPAPNPVPAGWTGWICVQANAAVPVGVTCCFQVGFDCAGVPGVIDVCATTCDWRVRSPQLAGVDWTNIGGLVRFHLRWTNPDMTGDSDPVSGDISSQPFGVFAQNFGPIGNFNVPPIPPNSFFDVFFDVGLDQLPPPPPKQMPGGGPPPGGPCPPDTAWDGNVDIVWAGPGGNGHVNKHVGDLLICPGAGPSYVHLLTFCPVPPGASWSIVGLGSCPGFSATLVNEDLTPAPNPVPPGWTGFICVSAAAATPIGVTCCIVVDFVCDGSVGRIDLCAQTCNWATADVTPGQANLDFGIVSVRPNPTIGATVLELAMPRAGAARLEIFNATGQRVRTLVDGDVKAGITPVRWDGRGENGRRLPPGAYFATFRMGDRLATRKVALMQ